MKKISLKYSGKEPLPKNCVFWKKTTLKEVTQGSFTMAKVTSGENAVYTYIGSLGITSLNRIVSIRTVMPEETATFL